MQPRFFRAGDRALLAELGSVTAAELHACAASIRSRDDVVAAIPGAESVYVIFDRTAPPSIPLELHVSHAAAPQRHLINVCFDGVDLEELLTRIGRDAFFARIETLTLTARYLGFRAGFAYLDGWPREWSMPRRPTSRPRVPRGSFAIAGATAGFYPIDSPGGWNLLGRTDAVLWDPGRPAPALIAPGDEVRILSVPSIVEPPAIRVDEGLASIDGIEIRGKLARVVGPADWSRIGHGIPSGGPFDPQLAHHANRLVGNDPDAPLIECAMLAPQIAFDGMRTFAWCGASCHLPDATPFEAAGALGGGTLRGGLRGWLAVRQSARSNAETGPKETFPARDERLSIRALAGPHTSTLRGEIACVVTPHIDRVGIRMQPLSDLGLEAPASLPSCGMQFGSVQLHPDGSLVALGPDHPVTGGYLQPFTVLWDERWKLAQLAPGERVVFEVN